jgi:hypothetical protein
MTYAKLEATAFLAALVATPDSEAVPTLSSGLLEPDPSDFLDAVEAETVGSLFWNKYQKFHQQLVAGYRIKERNKILESAGSEIDSDQFALGEITNTSLSAEEIIDSARKSFQKSGKEPLDWAATLTQWQP